MDKEKLLKELEVEFNNLKTRLKFKASFEEIDEIYHIRDTILAARVVNTNFYVQLINRLVECYSNWISIIHAWLMPPQFDLIYLNENKQLTEDERKELKSWLIQVMYLLRKNKEVFYQDDLAKGNYIDELVEFNEFHKKIMIKYHKKFKEYWEGEKSPSTKK